MNTKETEVVVKRYPNNGITTTYTFAFEFSKLDEDAFDKIMEANK